MARKPLRLPAVPEVTIEKALASFLEEQRARLKPRTYRNYQDVVGLLVDSLNGYAYQELNEVEHRFFDRHFNAEGEAHREFCQLFGPEKIPDHLGEFLGYFMIRKVMAGADFKRAAGTVTRKLVKWLGAQGFVAPDETELAAERAADATRDLPRAERAADLLRDAERRLPFDPFRLAEENLVDFDHFTVKRVEPSKIWLEHFADRTEEYGPIRVPKPVTDRLEQGWEISCSLARHRGRWHVVEVANIYP